MKIKKLKPRKLKKREKLKSVKASSLGTGLKEKKIKKPTFKTQNELKETYKKDLEKQLNDTLKDYLGEKYEIKFCAPMINPSSKESNIKNKNSCWNKAKDNETLFILRGQDKTSPRIVCEWIKENIDNPKMSEEKIRQALEAALFMARTATKKLPD